MTIAVRLPPEIEQRLQELAARTGRSKASIARDAIERFLEDEQIALERWREPDKRWTLEEGEFRNDPFARFDEWASEADTKGYDSL